MDRLSSQSQPTSNFDLKKGNKAVVADRNGVLVVVTINYRSVENGKVIYDYTDEYGNFAWCYSDQVRTVM